MLCTRHVIRVCTVQIGTLGRRTILLLADLTAQLEAISRDTAEIARFPHAMIDTYKWLRQPDGIRYMHPAMTAVRANERTIYHRTAGTVQFAFLLGMFAFIVTLVTEPFTRWDARELIAITQQQNQSGQSRQSRAESGSLREQGEHSRAQAAHCES